MAAWSGQLGLCWSGIPWGSDQGVQLGDALHASGSRAAASLRPVASCSSTSWWSSALSLPMNSIGTQPFTLVRNLRSQRKAQLAP